MIDQPAPEQRTCAGGECGGARPDPDRRAALLLVKRGADDRQRAGNEQRRPHALDGARSDQCRDLRRAAQPIEASVKVMTPVRKSTRRPKRSAAAPPIKRSADMHSVYALMNHCIAASVVPRSASIVGSATLTTDSSTNAMANEIGRAHA